MTNQTIETATFSEAEQALIDDSILLMDARTAAEKALKTIDKLMHAMAETGDTPGDKDRQLFVGLRDCVYDALVTEVKLQKIINRRFAWNSANFDLDSEPVNESKV